MATCGDLSGNNLILCQVLHGDNLEIISGQQVLQGLENQILTNENTIMSSQNSLSSQISEFTSQQTTGFESVVQEIRPANLRVQFAFYLIPAIFFFLLVWWILKQFTD
jgi:ATP-dependent Zn protease